MSWVYVILIFVALFILKEVLERVSEEKQEDLPYKQKSYLFSRAEHDFLKTLVSHIDTKRYMIFTKVRLADFIMPTAKGAMYKSALNKIISKHVDFLIWDVENNKIALLIELDGRSHRSERMRKRDAFVERLYEKVGLELRRVQNNADYVNEIKSALNLI